MRKVSSHNIIFMFSNLTSDLGPCILFVFLHVTFSSSSSGGFPHFSPLLYFQKSPAAEESCCAYLCWWKWKIDGEFNVVEGEEGVRRISVKGCCLMWTRLELSIRGCQRWDGRIFFWMGLPEVKNQSEKQSKWGLKMFLNVHSWTVIYKKGISPFFFGN